MTFENWIATIGVLLSFTTVLVIITRQVSNVVARQILSSKSELKEVIFLEIDKARKDFGETISSIRRHADAAHLKVQEVELYIRDNYVQINTFKESLDRIDRSIDRVIDKLDTAEATRILDKEHKNSSR